MAEGLFLFQNLSFHLINAYACSIFSPYIKKQKKKKGKKKKFKSFLLFLIALIYIKKGFYILFYFAIICFSCFLHRKKRLFEFRRSKSFRFRKCVFRGFWMRMGLHVGEIELFRVSCVFEPRKKDFLSFEGRNHFVFESVFFRGFEQELCCMSSQNAFNSLHTNAY